MKPYYKLQANDLTLQFESRFESGNLKQVHKVSDFEYDLYLKTDYATQGYTQWYFFKCTNTVPYKTYRFNICNLMKGDSNYSQGMKPLLYSVKKAKRDNIGWFRDGSSIAYYQSPKKRPDGSNFYCCSFQF